MLRTAMATQQVSGEIYQGSWWDIGTPERLKELNIRFKK
jgi:MurNAc alpha-1-phosphate uridylyltransferase